MGLSRRGSTPAPYWLKWARAVDRRADQNRREQGLTCYTVCSEQTPKTVRHGRRGRDLEDVGTGAEKKRERRRSRGKGMRGGEKKRGNWLTVSKWRWEKREVGERKGGREQREDILMHS